MRKILIKGLLILLLVQLVSCIKDPFELEDCFYKLRVELDFINTQPLDDKEQLKLVVVPIDDNDLSTDLTTGVDGRDVDLLVNRYHFVAYEPAANVSVIRNTVVVNTNADGTAMEPGAFSGGSADASVLANLNNQVLHVPLHLQRRQLIIQINLLGSGVPYVNGIKGGLDGISISRIINNGFEPIDRNNRPPAIKNGSINYTFQAKNRSGQSFTGSNFLLGIDGHVNQKLRLSAATSLGIVKDYELDVVDQLDLFHTKNVHEPWYIILDLSLDSKLEMTIVDWKTGPESELIAQ